MERPRNPGHNITLFEIGERISHSYSGLELEISAVDRREDKLTAVIVKPGEPETNPSNKSSPPRNVGDTVEFRPSMIADAWAEQRPDDEFSSLTIQVISSRESKFMFSV